MVPRVRHVDVSTGIHSYAPRLIEALGHADLVVGEGLLAEGNDELAIGRELLNAMVAGVGNVDEALIVDSDAARALKLPQLSAFAADDEAGAQVSPSRLVGVGRRFLEGLAGAETSRAQVPDL